MPAITQFDLQLKRRQSGFTIVELLIVIVVIGILAAITIVAYNGIQDRAKTTAVQSAATQASKKLLVSMAASTQQQMPATLADAGVNDTDAISYQYTSDNGTNPPTYCVTATGSVGSYYVSNTKALTSGVCPGHNLIVWDKVRALADKPLLAGATVDTSTFRTSTASLRIGVNIPSVNMRVSPFTGVAGQVYTVNLWMKTDATWNGTGGNSKIRFGAAADGALLTACSYNGVKATWTLVTCTYTITPASLGVNITVGNDGTVGNIWIDDLTVTSSL